MNNKLIRIPLGATVALFIGTIGCVEVQNSAGKVLDNARSVLYTGNHSQNAQNVVEEPTWAGDSYVSPSQEYSDSYASDENSGSQIKESAKQELDNAKSVIKHGSSHLWVEENSLPPAKRAKRPGGVIERSASQVLDNAGSVIRDGSARLWNPEVRKPKFDGSNSD